MDYSAWSAAAPFIGLGFVGAIIGLWYFLDEGLPNWRQRRRVKTGRP